MFSNLRSAALLASSIAIATLCAAQEAASPAAAASVNGGTASTTPLIYEPRHLLAQADQHGIAFHGTFVNDFSSDLTNYRADDWFGRYSFDLTATVDGSKLLGWQGATGFVRLKQHLQEFGSGYSEVGQVYSNIDAPSWTGLYELWLEQALFDNRLRFKVGKVDANTEFASVATAGDFLNSSMGFSPTIMAFPTYPAPKPSVNVFVVPKNHYQIGAAVYQTSGDGTMSITEASRTWSVGRSELDGHASFGYWHLFGKLHCFDGHPMSGTDGYYSVLEQALWRRPRPTEGNDLKLSSFVQFGYGNNEVNPFTRHFGVGAVLQGPFAARPHDSIALAVTRVNFSRDPTAQFDAHYESAIESYYKVTIVKPVAVLADLQYFRHPGGVMAHSDCLMFTPRLVISF